MLDVVLAFVTGWFVILSSIINANLSQKIGVFKGVLVNYIVGLGITLAILVVTGVSFRAGIAGLPGIPVWAFSGGLIGVVVVASSNVVVPKVPAVYMTLLSYIGQLGTGIFLDYARTGTAPLGRIIGVLFIVAGMVYNSMADKETVSNDSSDNVIHPPSCSRLPPRL